MINLEFRRDRVNWVLFLFICVAGFLMRLACATGLIASDDLWYSRFAQSLASLKYVPEPIHYALRYGLTIPVAIIYRLLGIREWTTYLWPLLASSASVPLLMIVGARLVGQRAALLGGLLLASFPVALLYATILVPEPVAGLYVLLGLLLYLETEEKRSLLFAILAGLTLGVAYLTKESAAFVVLALLIDALLRRRWRTAFGISVGAIAVVGVEFGYYMMATGDLLYRLHAMKMHEESPMVLVANQNLSYRLLKSYPRLMLLPSVSLGVHSTFALLVTALGLIRWRPQRLQLLLLWIGAPWLYLNFGSSSLTHYTALPVADRYLEFCYAPLFLLAGFVMDQWICGKSWVARPATACVTLVAATGLWCGYAMHRHGWHTPDVAVLREIACDAEQNRFTSVRFKTDPDGRWQQSMRILAPKLSISNEDSKADVLIGRDALGLPAAVWVSGAGGH